MQKQTHKQYLLQQKRKKRLILILQVGVLVLFLAVWEALASLNLIDSFVTSSPSRIVKTVIELTKSGGLWRHVWVSTYETLVGFAVGTALGYAVAVALWWNDTAKKVLEPYLVVLNSLPKIALGPLIILWVGTGKSAIIVMTILISVVVTTITILNGFCEVEGDKIVLLESMHASKVQIFAKLIAPANLPTLLAALKINVGMSWVGSIMGEYLVSKEGLGYLLIYGAQTFRLDLVMTCTILLCALAGVMYFAVALLEKQVEKRY